MKSIQNQNSKRAKIDAMRMKDIIAQLTDIIYFGSVKKFVSMGKNTSFLVRISI